MALLRRRPSAGLIKAILAALLVSCLLLAVQRRSPPPPDLSAKVHSFEVQDELQRLVQRARALSDSYNSYNSHDLYHMGHDREEGEWSGSSRRGKGSRKFRSASTKGFLAYLKRFDWARALEHGKSGNREAFALDHEELINHVALYSVHVPPTVPINASCKFPQATEPPRCGRYPAIFQATPRSAPKKLAVAIQFGFDVDVLEIALHQYFPIVDKIFILEGTLSHFHGRRKPLLWEHLKSLQRFRMFVPKVISIVLDDTIMQSALTGDQRLWTLEFLQERMRWERIRDWNDNARHFTDTDVIFFGDTDEIPSLEVLRLFSGCDLKVDRVDVGIWFPPAGDLSLALRTDHPVSPRFPYTLGDPTVYTFASAQWYAEENDKGMATRNRGESGHYVLGGAHLSDPCFLPFRLLKYLTCTECRFFRTMYLKRMMEDTDPMPWLHDKLCPPGRFQERSAPRAVAGEAVAVPWFLECNPGRFPVWHGKEDPRLALPLDRLGLHAWT